MFLLNLFRRFAPTAVYRLPALGFIFALLLQSSCSSNSNQQQNSQVRSDNDNIAPSSQATSAASPERRNDQAALNLVHVIHRWCDYKEEAYLETGLNLS